MSLPASILQLFAPDTLSAVMLAVTGFIGLIVVSFSSRYLSGDSARLPFFRGVAALIASIAALTCADHLVLFLIMWGASNWLLVRLMIHKSGWQAARAAGGLAARNFLLGFACLSGAFWLMHAATGQTTISGILASSAGSVPPAALVLLLIAALTQSAIWPFHRWLISSANSPTPVSALMHAGLVNGGGFLLARFAALYAASPALMHVMFALGIATVLLGTLWKLMQPDIKRMLACSTMGQMGFMLTQCGLGLFPAAIAHLCFHGLFKSYLFLASGSATREKRLDLSYPPAIASFTAALLCGLAGGVAFAYTGDKSFTDASLVLIAVAVIAGSQFALPMLREHPLANFLKAAAATIAAGAFYGLNIALLDSLLASMPLTHPQPLSALHLVGVLLLAAGWLAQLFGQSLPGRRIVQRLYVQALNASQPHPATITAHRNLYQH